MAAPFRLRLRLHGIDDPGKVSNFLMIKEVSSAGSRITYRANMDNRFWIDGNP